VEIEGIWVNRCLEHGNGEDELGHGGDDGDMTNWRYVWRYDDGDMMNSVTVKEDDFEMKCF
jgi:hypothetical protein